MAISKKDICVIGIGRFGYAVVEQLVNLRKSVLAIDKDEEKLYQVSRMTEAQIVDGADIDGLRDIGIENFNTVIVATSDNIETVATLLELGVKHIIAKAKSERHERVLNQIGVNYIVRPEAESGARTAFIATNPNFIKYSDQFKEIGDGYAIATTIVTNLEWLSQPIKNLNFKKYLVNIVSIKRNSKVIIPTAITQLRSKDIISVIGKITNITKIFAQLNDADDTKVIKLKEVEKAIKNK